MQDITLESVLEQYFNDFYAFPDEAFLKLMLADDAEFYIEESCETALDSLRRKRPSEDHHKKAKEFLLAMGNQLSRELSKMIQSLMRDPENLADVLSEITTLIAESNND